MIKGPEAIDASILPVEIGVAAGQVVLDPLELLDGLAARDALNVYTWPDILRNGTRTGSSKSDPNSCGGCGGCGGCSSCEPVSRTIL